MKKGFHDVDKFYEEEIRICPMCEQELPKDSPDFEIVGNPELPAPDSDGWWWCNSADLECVKLTRANKGGFTFWSANGNMYYTEYLKHCTWIKATVPSFKGE